MVTLDTGGDLRMAVQVKDGKVFTVHPYALIATACRDFERLSNADAVELWPQEFAKLCDQLTARVRELEAWKESAMTVEREWDPNQLAQMLGGKLGESQRAVIQREVPKLVERVKRLEELLDAMAADLNRGNGPDWEHSLARMWRLQKGQP